MPPHLTRIRTRPVTISCMTGLISYLVHDKSHACPVHQSLAYRLANHITNVFKIKNVGKTLKNVPGIKK